MMEVVIIKSIPIEIIVPVLAAISCLVTISQLGFPVWALFIGWAWYYVLGGKPDVFKSVYPAMIPGGILAGICIWFISIFTNFLAVMPAMMLAVLLTVFVLMCVLRFPFTSCGLAAFNGYSCVFATYYGGFFPQMGMLELNIFMALIWSLVAMFLGPIFGYLSIYLTFANQSKKREDENVEI